MQNELLIALLTGLGGMMGWGFSEFATKKSVDKIGTISSLVWAHVFGTIIIFSILLFSKLFITNVNIVFPTDLSEWLGIIFFGTLQTIVYYFSYKAFEKGKVGILSPIFASFAVIVAILSVLVFGEALNIGFVPALVLIFGGVMLINLDLESLKARRIRIKAVAGLKEIIIATILATVWTLGWDKFTGNKDWMVYTTLMFTFMTISAFLIANLAKINLLEVKSGAWKFLWLIAAGEVVAYLAITLGYASTTYTSVVAILSGASSLPTIILARVFLKEKIATIQTIGSLTIIAGIVFLSIS
ncbi:MAG: DMT family transporter [Candidatus Parcubacteria bacterium]|nr:DMT family transporter [Candidatus Parcubacteria bacterium]